MKNEEKSLKMWQDKNELLLSYVKKLLYAFPYFKGILDVLNVLETNQVTFREITLKGIECKK